MKYEYKGIPCDSDEEIMLLMLLFELQDEGFIKRIERSETIILSDSFVLEKQEEKILKTKTKTLIKNINVLEQHVYTPEFKVTWDNAKVESNPEMFFVNEFILSAGTTVKNENKKEKNSLLLENIKQNRCFFVTKMINIVKTEIQYVSYFEVKPEYDKHNMTRLFQINRKWVYDKYKIIINFFQP